MKPFVHLHLHTEYSLLDGATRIDEMLASGLVEEVRSLVDTYHLTTEDTSMQGIGYKEILGYLNGEYDLQEAIRILKRDTRHFAKRQLTWFRRERDVIWLDKDILSTEQKLEDAIMTHLAQKNIR